MLPIVALLAACVAPPELEDDAVIDTDVAIDALPLAPILPRLFGDFDDPTTLAALVARIADARDDAGANLDGPPGEREFSIDPILDDQLGSVTPPEGVDPAKQVSLVVFSRGRHDLPTITTTVLEANQVCIESGTTVYYTRAYTSDDACFRAGTCDTVTSTAEVRKELSILASGWYDFRKDFRRLTLDDGREAIVARGWIPAVYELDGGWARQTYTAEVWLEDGDVTEKTWAIWGEIEIGLNEVAMADLTSNALHEAQERQELWNETDDVTTYCGQDRARDNDRP